MIMDGDSMNVGALGDLKRIKDAIRVARKVMDHTMHTLLVGDGAYAFGRMLGFSDESLSTNYSKSMYKKWKEQQCQPNYYVAMKDSDKKCPPYAPDEGRVSKTIFANADIDTHNHDTIGMVAISDNHQVASTCLFEIMA